MKTITKISIAFLTFNTCFIIYNLGKGSAYRECTAELKSLNDMVTGKTDESTAEGSSYTYNNKSYPCMRDADGGITCWNPEYYPDGPPAWAQKLRSQRDQKPNVPQLGSNARPLPAPEASPVQRLRREGDISL